MSTASQRALVSVEDCASDDRATILCTICFESRVLERPPYIRNPALLATRVEQLPDRRLVRMSALGSRRPLVRDLMLRVLQ
jgi:hypothetical protein